MIGFFLSGRNFQTQIFHPSIFNFGASLQKVINLCHFFDHRFFIFLHWSVSGIIWGWSCWGPDDHTGRSCNHPQSCILTQVRSQGEVPRQCVRCVSVRQSVPAPVPERATTTTQKLAQRWRSFLWKIDPFAPQCLTH